MVWHPRPSLTGKTADPPSKRNAQREEYLRTNFEGAGHTHVKLAHGDRERQKSTMFFEKNALQSQSQGEFGREMNSVRQLMSILPLIIACDCPITL